MRRGHQREVFIFVLIAYVLLPAAVMLFVAFKAGDI
jgi:hypothetical protein